MTDTKPGDWIVISGIGGLGHMAATRQGDVTHCGSGRCGRRQAGSRPATGRHCGGQCEEGGLNGVTGRGSIVGSRLNLQESLNFAEQGKVAATVQTDRLENINEVFTRMHQGAIEGRVVLSSRIE
ncbi:D-arabinose 1-dehydrogenase-like Zn-dependent alcohol dehydrogenase [Xanthomonas arboricola]|nr:D-arabinose 1-dehydrogenase-like Zn-dependent alcohol dehydrogenase [Xanthomonas euroxanthea]